MSRLSKKILIWGTGEIENQIDEKEINGEIIGYIQSKKIKLCIKKNAYLELMKYQMIMII